MVEKQVACRCFHNIALAMDRIADAVYAPPHLDVKTSLKQAKGYVEGAERECKASFYDTLRQLERGIKAMEAGDPKEASMASVLARLELLKETRECK